MVVVWILDGELIFDCMMKMLLALAYPVCCMVVLYVAIVSCDDHQFILMGADGRGFRGQQGNGDSAAWPFGLDFMFLFLMGFL